MRTESIWKQIGTESLSRAFYENHEFVADYRDQIDGKSILIEASRNWHSKKRILSALR